MSLYVSFSLASGLPTACLGEPDSPARAVRSVISNRKEHLVS